MKKQIQFILFLIGAVILFNILFYFDIFGFKSNFAVEFVDQWQFITAKKNEPKIKNQTETVILRAENEVLKREINKLRKELQERIDLTVETLSATILTNETASLGILRGTKDRVERGQFVIVGRSMIGKIGSVEKTRSVVWLLNNENFSTNCNVEGAKGRIWGVLRGTQNKKIVLSKILQKEDVHIHEHVYCSGYYAGITTKIIRKVSDLYYEAEVAPAVLTNNLDEVWILINDN